MCAPDFNVTFRSFTYNLLQPTAVSLGGGRAWETQILQSASMQKYKPLLRSQHLLSAAYTKTDMVSSHTMVLFLMPMQVLAGLCMSSQLTFLIAPSLLILRGSG